MKFTITSLFVAGTLAQIVARDAATVQSALEAISSATTALNDQITSFSADSVAELQSASEAVIAAIKEGTASVEPSGNLEVSDALTLQQPLSDLGDLVSETVDNAIAKKSAFDEAGVGAVVLDQLQQQRAAAQEFSDTTIAKVPTAIQSVAEQLAQPILDALDKGVNAFSDETGSTSSSASASEPSATASATSAEATSAVATSVEASATASEATSAVVAPTYAATSTSGSVGTVTAPTSSATASLTPYDPSNGAASSAAGFGAVAVAALVAVVAF